MFGFFQLCYNFFSSKPIYMAIIRQRKRQTDGDRRRFFLFLVSFSICGFLLLRSVCVRVAEPQVHQYHTRALENSRDTD